MASPSNVPVPNVDEPVVVSLDRIWNFYKNGASTKRAAITLMMQVADLTDVGAINLLDEDDAPSTYYRVKS